LVNDSYICLRSHATRLELNQYSASAVDGFNGAPAGERQLHERP